MVDDRGVKVKRNDLPNVSKIGLALGVGVDEPSKPHASRERAGLRLTLPGEEEVLGHDTSVVVGGEATALSVVGAELFKLFFFLGLSLLYPVMI